MRLRRVVLTVASLLFAGNAVARVEFLLKRDGVRREGEVCFVRLPEAAKSHDPAEMFFATNDVRCVDAGKILDVPIGAFHFFGRATPAMFGATRGVVVVSQQTRAESYRAATIDLVPGATIEFSGAVAKLQEGEFFGVWLADTTQSLSTFIPLASGESSMIVPAGVPVVPMLIEGKRPVALGDVLTLRPGAKHLLADFRNAPGVSDVALWLQSDLSLLRRAAGEGNEKFSLLASQQRVDMKAPTLTLVDQKGVEHATAVPLVSPNVDGTVVVFKNVPTGPARLKMGGPTWEPAELALSLNDASPVHYVEEPLVAAPAGILTVRWLLAGGVADPARGLQRSCGAAAGPEPVTIKVYRCPVADDTAPIDANCTEVARKSVAASADGYVDFEALPMRAYRVEVEYPPFGTFRRSANVLPGHATTTSVQIEPFAVTGRVTRGGRPVRAEVRFATGQAVTDQETGELHALLGGSPLANLIDVRACDGSFRYVHIPKEPPTVNQRLLIEVPVTSVSVQVSDAASGAPVSGADVRYVVIKSMKDEAAYYSRTAVTDESGKAVVEGIPPERELIVCVRKEGFDRNCITTPFELKADETKELTLSIIPTATHAARLAGVTLPVRLGRLFWVSPEGVVLEETAVREDGTFGFRSRHGAPVSVVFASASHPLTVFPSALPADHAAVVELHVPQRPSRSFEVRIPANARRSGTRLALVVGGVAVPTRAYVHHQMYHGLQPDIVAGRPVLVRDVAATAPISVRFGPEPDDVSFVGDPFANPLLAGAFPEVAVMGPVVELKQ
jgi:hypothetical protein